jgi:hypothetical protein
MPGRCWQVRAPRGVTLENPPGLYGSDDGVLAHNLLKTDSDAVAAGASGAFCCR